MSISTIEDIKKQSSPKEIILPGWEEGETITVLGKRPSIFSLASQGKIPNALLASAQKVFTNQVDNSVNFKEISKVMEVIAEAVLVKPTFAELKKEGISLTDDQLGALFSFTQGGLKELENFRTNNSSIESDEPSDEV